MNSLEMTTISFKLYKGQAEIIERAARKARMSLSDYLRSHVVGKAAEEIGVPEPHYPEIRRGRGGSIVAQAAATQGVSVRDFYRLAAQAVAAQALGLSVNNKAGSGERKKAG